MRVLVVFLAIPAAIVFAFMAWVTVSGIAALIALLLVIVAVVLALSKLRQYAGWFALGITVVGLLAFAYGAWSVYQVARALTGTDGPVDAPNAADLVSANAKFDLAQEQAGFRIELTDDELTAVVLDQLADSDDNPLRSVELVFKGGAAGGPGSLEFIGTFKRGSLEVDGEVEAELVAGQVTLKLTKADIGTFKIPGIGRNMLENLVETVVDLNATLERAAADVQSVKIEEGRLVITGLAAGGQLVTLDAVLEGVREGVAGLGTKLDPPVETLGPGDLDVLEADGPVYYIALGDSLAANVGVDSPREGYVSRFHRQLAVDSPGIGLRNLGVSGETSGGLISRGQMDAAIGFMKEHEVAFVTIDIGANDLLGHLYSEDCRDTIQAPACQERLEQTIATYEANLDKIFARLTATEPQATILFLGMYNPFSIGFGSAVAFEAESDAVVERVNRVAKERAEAAGVRYADGQAPIKGRAGAVTHMLDAPPDIHPRAIGYDLLAVALVSALR